MILSARHATLRRLLGGYDSDQGFPLKARGDLEAPAAGPSPRTVPRWWSPTTGASGHQALPPGAHLAPQALLHGQPLVGHAAGREEPAARVDPDHGVQASDDLADLHSAGGLMNEGPEGVDPASVAFDHVEHGEQEAAVDGYIDRQWVGATEEHEALARLTEPTADPRGANEALALFQADLVVHFVLL